MTTTAPAGPPSPAEAPAPKRQSGGPLAILAGLADGAVRHRRGLARWGRRLAVLVIALVVLWYAFRAAVGLITNDMWFNSVRAGEVYTTQLRAQIILFVVFGVLAAVICGLTMRTMRRLRPLPLTQEDDTFRWMFRRVEPKIGRLLVVLAAVIPGIVVGKAAAANWQNALLWWNSSPWHTTDPLFHRDVSFYVDVLPFHQLVVSLLSQAVTYAAGIALVAGYWYGAWRIRRGRRKLSRGLTVLASVVGAGWLVLQAANAWLSRYALTTSSRGPVTGASWTDVHVALPGAYVLMVVLLLAAAALVANAFLGARFRVLGGALILALVVTTAASSTIPNLFFHYREAPSAAKLDLNEIRDNQAATRDAFALGDVTTTPAASPPSGASATELAGRAQSENQLSVLDPNQLSPTFNVEQQLQAYYGFKSTLDLAHYPLGGRQRDVALAVRELHLGGIPHPTWVNNHLVYTHGYGVVAAPTTEVDSRSQSPDYLDPTSSANRSLRVTRPQVYFGQAFGSSSFAIVGQPKGSATQLEFDHPAGVPGPEGDAPGRTTYSADGGIPIGSTLRRLLFAVRMGDPNILFSSELNSASQLLTVRDPRARVAKVAPWLTPDGNVYPAVVNGHIVWVVDSYTSTSNYPNSQLVNLGSATNTTLVADGASVAQSGTVNYLRNSVKAVVDAYTGRVTLYSWDQKRHPDPLLRTWQRTFPGLVKPQSDIPSALLPQLRYPTDLFNVQRSLIAKYHVTQPAGFYSGNDFWTVPTDPTVAAASSLNSGPAATSAPLPSLYMDRAGSTGEQRFRLSSPMVTLNGQQLAAYISVDAEPGPGYGTFSIDTYRGAAGESPAQVQNDIESNTTITESLTLQRGGNSSVVLGDLQAVPVAGRMLYVEPVYTRSSGGSSFPILRHVIALYGDGDPSFRTTLSAAVSDAIRSGTSG